MNILSADTSTSILSLALKTDKSYEERQVSGGFSPSENLMSEIKTMLKRAELELKDLDLLICTKGPGSFTGLRITLSLFKGIALALDIPLVSVPTLEAIERTVEKLYPGYVLSLIDAKKMRYYYRLTKNGEVIISDRDEKTEEIIEKAKKLGENVLFTGPDALSFYNKAQEYSPSPLFILDYDSPRNLSKALIELGCKIYAEKGGDDIGEGPVYIRRSDAEEMLLKKTEEENCGK